MIILFTIFLTFLSFVALSFSLNLIHRTRTRMRSDSDSESNHTDVQPAANYFLAFGDSLTEGYYQMGFQFHPYTEKLEELFTKQNFSISLVNRGISGETTWRMIPRLERILSQTIKYNFICILAGTNDLADSSESAETLFERLRHLYQIALSHNNATLIVITIPATGFDHSDRDYLRKKITVNEMIRAYYEENKNGGRILFVDLYTAAPYYLPNGGRSPVWDDNLHFNPQGYDFLGELIFNSLQSSITTMK